MNPWISLPALVPFGFTVFNALAWRPPRAGARPAGRISALVPARNEARNIDACLAALVATDVDEIVVLDDASTDETPLRVLAWAARDPRVRLLRGSGPPSGWLGKPAACEALLRGSRGDWVLFVDADVRVEPDALRHLGRIAADLVSAVPRQDVECLAERLVIPLLDLTYMSWLLLPAIRWSRNPAVIAACGQFVFARRAAIEALGGFGCVRHEVVDDIAFARAARRAGLRVDFIDGTGLARCRMYGSTREVIDGFSKNLYPGIGASPLALGVVLALYTTTLLLPWLALPWVPGAFFGVVANLLQRVVLAVRFRHRPLDILLHPFAILAFIVIALRSAWWSWSGSATWRGRPVST